MDKENIKRVLYQMIEEYRNYMYLDKIKFNGGMNRNYLRNIERSSILKYLLEKEKKG